MFSPEALTLLAQADAIRAAGTITTGAIGEGKKGFAALPSDFKTHDLEDYLPNRRRARGAMATPNVQDFAAYVATHKEPGATVFVAQSEMKAAAVLNLGTPDAPGHTDNKAVFSPERTAAYSALLSVAGGQAMTQTTAAEFLEDWAFKIACSNDEGAIENKKAIAAVRKITIENLKKIEAEEGQLSAQRSAFESAKASSTEPIPTTIVFKCEPYHGFATREFSLRLGVRTGDKQTITLRIVNAEQHAEEMAAELAQMVRDHAKDVPVLIGTYSPRG